VQNKKKREERCHGPFRSDRSSLPGEKPLQRLPLWSGENILVDDVSFNVVPFPFFLFSLPSSFSSLPSLSIPFHRLPPLFLFESSFLFFSRPLSSLWKHCILTPRVTCTTRVYATVSLSKRAKLIESNFNKSALQKRQCGGGLQCQMTFCLLQIHPVLLACHKTNESVGLEGQEREEKKGDLEEEG
jgi:hypothetical protein